MGLFASIFYDDGKVPLDDAGRFLGRCHIRKGDLTQGHPFIINIEVLQRSI